MNRLVRAYRSLVPRRRDRTSWETMALLELGGAGSAGLTARQLRQAIEETCDVPPGAHLYGVLARLQRDGEVWARWETDAQGERWRRFFYGPKPEVV